LDLEILQSKNFKLRRPKKRRKEMTQAGPTQQSSKQTANAEIVTIEVKNKHFKIDKHPELSRTNMNGKPSKITWKYKGPLGPSVLKFWFPNEEPPHSVSMWEESKRDINLNQGETELTLTVHPNCPYDTYPHAIYCDIDGTTEFFNRPGHQMVEGLHSHPDHVVGP
jgi:hypothetical protein